MLDAPHVFNEIMALGDQLRLRLEHSPDFGRDRFVVSSPNSDAVSTLDEWPGARGGALALIGPAGSGKTHLAMAWAARAKADILADPARSPLDPSGKALLDEADVADHGEAFFHLLNRSAAPGHALLLTGRTPPKTWPVQVQDLRSRLNALPVIELGAPDDVILRGVLVKLFAQRHIRPPHDLLAYLLLRMERSVPAAQAMVAALDETASAERRPISRALAREMLKDETDEGTGEEMGEAAGGD